MRVPLAHMAKAKKVRRSRIVLKPVRVPATLATDLFHIYRPAFEAWTDAADPILAAYERTLAQLVTDAPQDVTAAIGQVEAQLSAAMLTIRLRLAAWAARLEKSHRKAWTRTVLDGTHVDIETMIGPQDARITVGAAVERNVALVKSVSDQARTRIADAVFRGFRNRVAATVIAREIRETVAMQRARALRIAADQTVKLGAALNEERRRQAGIDTWQWVHSHKAHPRPEHVARDGRTYSDNDPPSDMPGELPYCGCTSRAVLDLDAMIERELRAA
jgi:SPP1 gp7 family putative phage head morphogenesis protein